MRKSEENSFKKILWISVMVPMLLSLSVFGAVSVKIMPLGDSITHEDYRDPVIDAAIPDTDRSAYRNDLWYSLQGGGYNVDFVGALQTGQDVVPAFDFDHQGTNGLLDSEMAANVYNYLTAQPADIVLLHIGTNGVIDDNGATDVENTLKEIDRYESDNNTHVKVILSRIISCWEAWDNIAAGVPFDACTIATINEITTFNDNVEAMANARILNGDDIVIVDMENGASFAYDGTDMIDGLHPNAVGYAKMANVFYTSLESSIPTHQWKLEEVTQPYIDAYRDTNGACVTDCPIQTSGIIGSAQLFDGSNDEVNVVDDGTFNWAAGDSFTLEFWMKPNSTTNLQVAVGRHAGTSGNGSWWVGREGSKVRLSIGESITSTIDIDTTGTQWTHVVAIKDIESSQIKLYINGDEDSSTVITSSVNFVGSEPVNIGWFDTSFWYDGVLDEMTVYNGALNADQIKQHYNTGIGAITLAITSTPVESAVVGGPYSYDVNSNDPSATFSLTNNPGWMDIINSSTGIITGTPTTVGNDNATVRATSGSQTVDQSFVVKVRDIASLPTSMIHYLKLNDNDPADKTYIDEYNGETDATCSAGCPTQVLGQVDAAQDFSALNSDLNVPDDASSDWAAGDSFTVELWMKANNTAGTEVAIGRHAGTSGNGSWWIGRDSNKVKVSIGGAATITSNADIDISGNRWIHVVAVKDVANSVMRLYINGVEDNTTPITSSVSFIGTEPVNIGWFFNGFYFDGTLDDIAIFDGALAPSEIAAHHANGSAGKGFDNPDVTAPVITLTGVNPQEILIGDVYTELDATANDDVDGDVSGDIVIDASGVNTNAEGSYTVSYEVDDTAGNTGTATRTVNVTTGNDPVITLSGDNPYTIEVDSIYADPGASATDIEDGTVTVSNDSATSVDEAIVGTYTVSYTATDSHGNTVQTTRTVKVVDTTAPVITLTGGTVNLLLNDIYAEPGVSCTDNYDASCTVVTGGDTVDTSAVGNYTVTYDATDASGNTATTRTRIVNVTAGNAPVITLIGDNPYIIEVHSSYVDPGATATDIEDSTVAVTNDSATSINTSNLGDQTVTYTSTDSHGNTAQATRTVKVLDTTAPVITLTGSVTINLLLNDIYTEPGVSCTDNYDANCTVVTGGDTVDTSTVGNYTVTYDATDAAGNAATQVIRTVNVIAGNAPVITLNGDNPFTVEVDSTYVDPGASATDSEDGTVAVTNDSATSVDTAIVGTYTVTYTATDSHGNTVQEIRTVNVTDIPVDDWYSVSPDGNTYTVTGSSVVLEDSNLFTITVGTDSIVFEEIGSDPKVYIIMMNNGEVFTGYSEGSVKNPTIVNSGFAPGTKVSVGADMDLFIETTLTTNLTFEGK